MSTLRKGLCSILVILKDFFVNFSILCTGIFLIHQYLLSDKVMSKPSVQRRILGGILHGLFGALLMQFGIPITGGVVVDLRSVPMMIAAYAGGWISTFVATAVIIIFRFLLYPITFSSFFNIFTMTSCAIAFSFICRANIIQQRKWLFMCVWYIVLLGATIHFVIPDFKLAFMICVQYALAFAGATFATYMLKSYLWRMDDTYEKLKEMSNKDHLTGLNNARSFKDAMLSALAKAKEKEEQLSLLSIDIDHFKQVNDTYGHPAGDKVLQEVGHILMQSCRSIDIVSRNGGEEFSIIMPACDCTSARTIAERIRKNVEQNVFVINEDIQLKVTVSIGYTTHNQKNIVSIGQLIHQADEGLYKAKRTGRNRISFSSHFESPPV